MLSAGQPGSTRSMPERSGRSLEPTSCQFAVRELRSAEPEPAPGSTCRVGAKVLGCGVCVGGGGAGPQHRSALRGWSHSLPPAGAREASALRVASQACTPRELPEAGVWGTPHVPSHEVLRMSSWFDVRFPFLRAPGDTVADLRIPVPSGFPTSPLRTAEAPARLDRAPGHREGRPRPRRHSRPGPAPKPPPPTTPERSEKQPSSLLGCLSFCS